MKIISSCSCDFRWCFFANHKSVWICCFRSTEVLPEGAPRTSNELPALWRLDTGIQARLIILLLQVKSTSIERICHCQDNWFGTLRRLEAGLIMCLAFNHLTFSIFSSVTDPDKRLQALWVVCDKLPKNNKTNLRSVQRVRSRQAVLEFTLLLINHHVFPAGIWWSFCPNWLRTARWTKWLQATSPLSWGPTCCGPRLRGERGR